jgi:hypothetical protein
MEEDSVPMADRNCCRDDRALGILEILPRYCVFGVGGARCFSEMYVQGFPPPSTVDSQDPQVALNWGLSPLSGFKSVVEASCYHVPVIFANDSVFVAFAISRFEGK